MLQQRWQCKNVQHNLLPIHCCSELYWTAPELLREDVVLPYSQPGDVYSYGIILSELLSREEPYSSLTMEPRGRFLHHHWPRATDTQVYK